MPFRSVVFALLLMAASSSRAQQAFPQSLPAGDANPDRATPSAWLDLRQAATGNSKTQVTPPWVEAVTLVPAQTSPGTTPTTVFRIRVSRPKTEYQILLFRLFFDDKANAQPELIAWDESGTQVVRSGPLGAGMELSTSEQVVVPMMGVSAIDVQVPGDGSTVRGAYLDWMSRTEVVHPVNAAHRDLMAESFGGAPPLRASENDIEEFGTVTATLAPETIRIGPNVPEGAAFQFGMEAQPLLALLTFEVASPNVKTPPEVYVNGEAIGPASLALPDLADPGYRGEMKSLVRQMEFHYTGWVRAQKMVPAALLRAGPNDVIVISGSADPSAIRATQIQLKYLWDKSDYLLRTDQ
jgi:hypothetical protein